MSSFNCTSASRYPQFSTIGGENKGLDSEPQPSAEKLGDEYDSDDDTLPPITVSDVRWRQAFMNDFGPPVIAVVSIAKNALSALFYPSIQAKKETVRLTGEIGVSPNSSDEESDSDPLNTSFEKTAESSESEEDTGSPPSKLVRVRSLSSLPLN